MQADPVGRLEPERRVVRLVPRAPHVAVVRPDHERRMRVHRQVEPAATARRAVVADVVVRERRVVVPDQQPVLVRVVLDPVRLGAGEPEVVRARCAATRRSRCTAVLGEVGVEVRLVHRRPDTREARIRPAGIGLGAVERLPGDRDVVDEETLSRDRAVGPVAEADRDRAGVRLKVRRQVDPTGRGSR